MSSPEDSAQEPATELRVLLFSPIAGREPLSGDTSYTEALVRHPPHGVRYTTYAEALSDGSLRRRGRLRDPPPRGSEFGVDLVLQCLRLLQRGLRAARIMFREPVWFITVDASAYDLIHAHLFALAQVGPQRLPIMSSYGLPLGELYQSREGWGARHARLAEFCESVWAKLLKVHVPWLHQVNPSIMAGYSEAANAYLVRQGADPDTVRLISTGLPAERLPPPSRSGHSLLFVGRDFHRKGGDRAVAAFRALRAENADVHLTVVTTAQAVPAGLEPEIRLVLDPTREEVIQEIMPEHDILLAPTRLDCGAPYAVLEALRSGMPVVLATSPWLDHRLSTPAVTSTDGSPAQVAASVRALLDPAQMALARAAAVELWRTTFTTDAVGRELRAAYDDVLRYAG